MITNARNCTVNLKVAPFVVLQHKPDLDKILGSNAEQVQC